MLNNLINNLKKFKQNCMILCNKFIGQIQLLFSSISNSHDNKKIARIITFIKAIRLDQFKKLLAGIKTFSSSKDARKECMESIKKGTFWSKIIQEFKILATGEVNEASQGSVPEGILGVCINGNNIILVHLIQSSDLEITIKSHGVFELKVTDLNFQDQQEKLEIQKVITEYVQKNNLTKVVAAYALSTSQYVISLVELPNDPNTTRDKAILWSVKDYINYSIDDAMLDSFDIPANRAQDNIKLAYAVAMRAKLSQDIGELLHKCGIHLKYIDINELCIRNIIGLYPELKQQGCLVLKVFDNYSNILLIKNDALFISRSTKLNIRQLDNFDPLQDNLPAKFSIAEGLLLELQRSLDYANNMFRGLNFNSICILPCNCNLDKVINWLKEQSGLSIMQIDVSKVIKCENNIQPDLYGDWVLAVGAALRNLTLKEKINATTDQSV